MGLLDSFDKGYQWGADFKYGPKEREAAYQKSMADLAMKQAEAQNAPEFFGSRANQMTSQAGLSGLELKYAPERFSMEKTNNGLSNALRQMQLQQMKSEMAAGGGYKPDSPMGKLFQDYQYVVSRYGENSPQAQQFKAALDREANGKEGMTVFDPVTGNPLVSTGNKSTGGFGGGGGTYVDPQTGKIVVQQTNTSKTRDQRTISGQENVGEYLKTIQKDLPFTFTAKDQAKAQLQGFSNRFLGTNYEYPSKLAEGDAAVTTMAEGFINTFGLNATNENVEKAEKIFRPRKGESSDQWLKRTTRQGNDLVKVAERARGRQASGIDVGQSQMPQFQGNGTQLRSWADEAIAKGADPEAVKARIAQMNGGQ